MHGFVPQLCERCEHTSYGKGRGRGRSRDRSRPRSRHRRRRRISCSTCTSTDSCDSCRGGHRRPREGGRRSTETSRRRDSDRGHGRGRNSKRDAEVRCYGHGGPGLDVSYGYDYGYGYDWGRHGTSRRGGQSAASRLGEDAPAEYFRMAEDAARVQRQAARQARWLFGEYWEMIELGH